MQRKLDEASQLAEMHEIRSETTLARDASEIIRTQTEAAARATQEAAKQLAEVGACGGP